MDKKINVLKDMILREGIIRESEHLIINTLGTNAKWIFDLRPLLLNSNVVSIISDIFWEKFSDRYPFQVGCQETAAIPLLGAIIEHGARISKPIKIGRAHV